MKPAYVKIIPLSVLLAVAVACSKSSSSNTNTCSATTGDAIPLTSNMRVSYTASVTGGATIGTISYQDSAGTTTVNNPSLPFSKSVNLKSGSTASITASGSAGSGQITVTSNGINRNSASCN
jgi:hypothetical protein